MTKNWDERERTTDEKDYDLKSKSQLINRYVPLVKEYARLNNIEIPAEDDDYLNFIYGFVWHARFMTMHLINLE